MVFTVNEILVFMCFSLQWGAGTHTLKHYFLVLSNICKMFLTRDLIFMFVGVSFFHQTWGVFFQSTVIKVKNQN